VSISLLFTLLLGAVEFGRFAYLAIEIANAAKAAAQYGAQNSITAADVTGMQLEAAKDAPDVAKACTHFTTAIAQPATCSCVVSGASSSAACDGSTACSGYIVQKLTITTSAQCKPIAFPKGFGGTLTISGHAVQEVLR
jgi:Flp pilus assembly protein TadG